MQRLNLFARLMAADGPILWMARAGDVAYEQTSQQAAACQQRAPAAMIWSIHMRPPSLHIGAPYPWNEAKRLFVGIGEGLRAIKRVERSEWRVELRLGSVCTGELRYLH